MARLLQRAAPANQVRIIGGKWRSRILRFPATAVLRPTPDRVRETLFNWLGQDLTDLATLDLFAGSGALSFESLSRGARLAVAVDAAPDAVAALTANATALKATGLEVHRADAATYLAGERRRFDVVFLDPPFAHSAWPEALWPLLAGKLNRGGLVYLEQPREIEAPARFERLRASRAGRVHYHLLRLRSDPMPSDNSSRPAP
jgi:16S rRNA (guanine966-N2)-methyltransferase